MNIFKPTQTTLLALCLSCVFTFALTATNALGAVKEKISVTISPAVQEQIQKLPQRHRKRIETAIRSGNRFIPRYFDGSAIDATEDSSHKKWHKNIRPLVNKDFDEWTEMILKKQSKLDIEIPGIATTFFIGLCPQAELIALQVEAGLVKLRYRARIIGAAQDDKGFTRMQSGFLIDGKEDYQEAFVVLDSNNKVDYVEKKFRKIFVTTDFFIETYNPDTRFGGLDLTNASPVEKTRAKKEVQRYLEWVKLLKEQEAAVCKAN